MGVDTTPVFINDLEDLREVLKACENILHARDLQEAQINFTSVRPSPLAIEVERVKTRFDGYLSDFLLARYESEIAESTEEAENGSQELLEASEEELSSTPLGDFKPPKQTGRKLTAEELQGEE